MRPHGASPPPPLPPASAAAGESRCGARLHGGERRSRPYTPVCAACSPIRCVTACAVRTSFSWHFNPLETKFQACGAGGRARSYPAGFLARGNDSQPFKFCPFEVFRAYTGRLEEQLFLCPPISSFLPSQGKEP